ncbi:MAG: molybdopterin-binding protein [Coprobacillaceae bacterium]
MIVEIINVGTELLLGEIVNTNATYIQKMCKELGFNVYHQSVVGDNPERFKECLDIAFKRGADCVITTGGLGPTPDDLTKELSAEYLGLELVYIEEEGKKVEEKCIFVTGWDTIPKNNFKQAWYPKDAFILENEVGTANACVMSKDEKMIINLPGPPKEMQYVVDHSLKAYLQPYKKDRIYTHEYITMGIGESRVAESLKDIIDQQKDVSIALYASEESVRIRLGCIAFNKEEANNKMKETKKDIEQIIGKYCLKDNNLKEALYNIMPPYHFRYDSSFTMRDNFILGKEVSYDNQALEIEIDNQPHQLGEIVTITFLYKDRKHAFKVPLLKKAELSYPRLESRIIQNLYTFIQETK